MHFCSNWICFFEPNQVPIRNFKTIEKSEDKNSDPEDVAAVQKMLDDIPDFDIKQK
jgi:hypothetical protein